MISNKSNLPQSETKTIKKGNGKFITNIKTNCTALNPFNFINLNSTLGIGLNKFSRNITHLFPVLREQMVGHILGDASIYYTRTSIVPIFRLNQGLHRFEYLWFSYSLLSSICLSLPKVNHSRDRRNNQIYSTIYFMTRSYFFLIELHQLFYQSIEGKWVKFISDDLIFELTPRSLAFWFMDDGAFGKSGLILHTNGYTFSDVYKLAGMLHYLFGLNVTVRSVDNHPIIYIRKESVELFKSLVLPYMHPSMHYKFSKK